LESGLKRIEQLDHPIVRGATWAAFATYAQFYLDGNKRTGRYVMNAVLMSHGYDAILIPASLKSQYEDVLVESYRSGDLTPHIDFLLGLYGDD
jgi:Fic family protein